MDDAAVVSVFEGGSDLHGQVEHFRPGQPALFLEEGFDVGAVDVFHGEEGAALVDAGFEKADNVGVIKLPQDVDLALKARRERGIDGELGGEHLDRGQGGRRPLGMGQEHPGHAAATQLAVQNPPAQPRSDHVSAPNKDCVQLYPALHPFGTDHEADRTLADHATAAGSPKPTPTCITSLRGLEEQGYTIVVASFLELAEPAIDEGGRISRQTSARRGTCGAGAVFPVSRRSRAA